MKSKTFIAIFPLMFFICTLFLSTPVYAAENFQTVTQSESAIPDNPAFTEGNNPLTPNGTGTVIDNVTDSDGKEFFTIITEDGDYFYMIIDRQRSTENVYLLNTVTEADLMALAEKNGKTITGEASVKEEIQETPETTSTAETVETAQTPPTKNNGVNNETLIYIAAGAIVVGIIGYYLKIVRPKKRVNDEDENDCDEEEDKYDYDDDYSNEDDDGY